MMSRRKKGHVILLVLALLLALSACSKNEEEKVAVSRAKISFSLDGRDLTAYYTGILMGNRPYGEGIYEFEDENGAWGYAGTLENGTFANGQMTNYPYVMNIEGGSATYSGPFENGKPSGDGTYVITIDGNTAVLEGHYDAETGFAGYASNLAQTFVYNDVSFSGFYTGEILEGKPNGNGKFDSEGELFFHYDGNWTAGEILGPGTLRTNNARMSFNGTSAKATYRGNIENGCFNGEGSIEVSGKDGTHYFYMGSWKDSAYSGEGTLSVTSPGGIDYAYTGSWRGGRYHGDGALIYDSPDIVQYVGNFENGDFRPTFPQLVTCLCSAENNKLEMADHVKVFVDQFQADFLEHKTDTHSFLNYFPYDAYAWAPNETNSVCFSIYMRIEQMKEYNADVFGVPVTEFVARDSNSRLYHGYYAGSFGGAKSGDSLRVWGYPIGYTSYANQSNTSAVRFLVFSVE